MLYQNKNNNIETSINILNAASRHNIHKFQALKREDINDRQ